MGMCGPEDPLFTPLLQFTRVPFQAKESVHKTPFWENLEILASTASLFAQILAPKPPNLKIFSSQAPKLGNFQFTSPQIGKFSVHKPPPLFRGKNQSASPTLRKSGPHTCTWRKSWVPSPYISHKLYTWCILEIQSLWWCDVGNEGPLMTQMINGTSW